mgnify:CR=1 FL=1
MTTVKMILKHIGESNLSLYKGQGYYYFVYDDGDKVYEERCVMVNVMNHLSLDSWVYEGKRLVDFVKAF